MEAIEVNTIEQPFLDLAKEWVRENGESIMLSGYTKEEILEKYSNWQEFIYAFIITLNHEDEVFTQFLDGTNQCHRRARRSLGDLYGLVRHYYDNVNIIEIAKFLLGEPAVINMAFCPDIKKAVFYSKAYVGSKCNLDDYSHYPITSWIFDKEMVFDGITLTDLRNIAS